MTVRSYSLDVPDEVLDDLRARLRRTRWVDQLPGVGWEYGADVGYIRELCEYWASEYDWRAHERMINTFPQFVCEVDGVDIHFWHVKGKGPKPFPLLLVHGWPGSIYEFNQLLGPLSDPEAHGGDAADAFDLVVPSIPGFGFSGHPREKGWGCARVAEAFGKLMTDELGYEKYGAQGGDLGSFISQKLGSAFPENAVGIHLNFVLIPGPIGEVAPEDREALARVDAFNEEDGGYRAIQGKNPDTIGISQADSPAGLAAWIIEKFRKWSDCGGDLESVFSKDTLLTNLMFYWAPNSASSAARMYYESHHDEPRNFGFPKPQVPTGFAVFPGDPFNMPRSWAEKNYNVVQWTDMPRGGHFAALEEPHLLCDDIRAFFRGVR